MANEKPGQFLILSESLLFSELLPDRRTFGVGISFAAAAAKSIIGISFGGKTIIRRRTVARGF